VRMCQLHITFRRPALFKKELTELELGLGDYQGLLVRFGKSIELKNTWDGEETDHSQS
jgi:hypothetical protein